MTAPAPTLAMLRAALDATLADAGRTWLAEASTAVAADGSALPRRFAAAGRALGRGPLAGVGDGDGDGDGDGEWTVDEAARVLLLAAAGTALADGLADLYRFADAHEQRAVLRALAVLPPSPALDAVGRDLIRDALRSNDVRLVAGALGPAADRLLDAPGFRHGVLKAVFMGLPLAAVHRLDERADGELHRMLAAFAHERRAAGRPVPADVRALLARPPSPPQEVTCASSNHTPT